MQQAPPSLTDQVQSPYQLPIFYRTVSLSSYFAKKYEEVASLCKSGRKRCSFTRPHRWKHRWSARPKLCLRLRSGLLAGEEGIEEPSNFLIVGQQRFLPNASCIRVAQSKKLRSYRSCEHWWHVRRDLRRMIHYSRQPWRSPERKTVSRPRIRTPQHLLFPCG